MAIVKWAPYRDVGTLSRSMDRWFDDRLFWSVWPTSRVSGMALDVYQTDESLVVKATLPGIKPEEVKVTVTGDHLTIEGESGAEEEKKEHDYVIRERRVGASRRVIRLPEGLDTEKAEGSFEEGVLTLTIPRAESAKPKSLKIDVKAKK